VYTAINNGVYRAGFATSQAGYDAAVGEMHALMAQLDERLGQQRFLLADRCVCVCVCVRMCVCVWCACV
jgi:putative glutathione S-transferase